VNASNVRIAKTQNIGGGFVEYEGSRSNFACGAGRVHGGASLRRVFTDSSARLKGRKEEMLPQQNERLNQQGNK